ncbi:MAG: primase C-terminal domain-containing protein [Tepidisphaeraceae bacterium]
MNAEHLSKDFYAHMKRLGHNPNLPVEFRLIDAAGVVESLWYRPADFAAQHVVDELLTRNERGFNVYCNLNQLPGRGQNKIADITQSCVLAAEWDFKGEPFTNWTPQQKLQQAKDAIRRADLPEAGEYMNSGHGIWAIWPLTEPCVNTGMWKNVMLALSAVLDSDKAIADAARIGRIPGFLNFKKEYAEPAQSCIVEQSDATFSFADLVDRISKARAAGIGRKDDAGGGNVGTATRKAAAPLPTEIHEGEGRDNAVTSFVGSIHNRLNNRDSELEQAKTFNRTHCKPPLPESDLIRIVNSIGKYEVPEHVAARSKRPRVILGTDEQRVTDEVIDVLATADPELYRRGNLLVRVVRAKDRSKHGNKGITRPAEAPTIADASASWVRERITAFVNLRTRVPTQRTGPDDTKDAHPPEWLSQHIIERKTWPDVRPLDALSDVPILRPDGTLHQKSGYDPESGVLYLPSADFPLAPENATREDAKAAALRLLDVFCDFPFEAPCHRSVALAGILTLISRHAIAGNVPVFAWEANTRGAGKGLGCNVTSAIALGRRMSASDYTHDTDEFKKRLLAVAIAADPVVLLDNVEGMFGNSVLNGAITSERISGRVLGLSKNVDLPLRTVWFVTGNNIEMREEIARRTLTVRLEAEQEKPEYRSGFRHPDLLGWVMQNRISLLIDALTIVGAYCRAGKPDQQLTPFGSFEEWSALIRSAIVWCGLADPCAAGGTPVQDETLEALSEFTSVCRRQRYSTKELDFRTLVNIASSNLSPDSAAGELRTALQGLAGYPSNKMPSNIALGKCLRRFRNKRFDGNLNWRIVPSTHHGGNKWRLYVGNEPDKGLPENGEISQASEQMEFAADSHNEMAI